MPIAKKGGEVPKVIIKRRTRTWTKPKPGSSANTIWQRVQEMESRYSNSPRSQEPIQPPYPCPIHRQIARTLSDIAFAAETRHRCEINNPPLVMSLHTLFQRMLNKLRVIIETADRNYILPFVAKDVLMHCVLAFEEAQNISALREINIARKLAWHWVVKTPKNILPQTHVVVLKSESIHHPEAQKTAEEEEAKRLIPPAKPKRGWCTAREIADAIEGDPELGRTLKKLWDKRRGFYPEPVGKKGKQTNLYFAEDMLSRAFASGDVREEDLPKIREILGLAACRKITKPSSKSKISS